MTVRAPASTGAAVNRTRSPEAPYGCAPRAGGGAAVAFT